MNTFCDYPLVQHSFNQRWFAGLSR